MSDSTTPNAGFIEDTLPDRPRRDIDPFEDQDYVVEGAVATVEEPADIAGKTREEIAAELRRVQGEVAAERARADPVAALQQTLSQVLAPRTPAGAVVPGWQRSPQQQQQQNPYAAETPEQRKAREQELWLSDPGLAARQVAMDQQQQLAMLVANNQAQLSRELLLTNGETKKLYERYSTEVEDEVAGMSPLERVQNPRSYQTALERVKMRHQDELMGETLQTQVAEMVAAKLKELGIGDAAGEPGRVTVPVTAASATPRYSGAAGAAAGRPVSPAARTTITIPAWVEDEALRKGLDPKFYYHHLKGQGRI